MNIYPERSRADVECPRELEVVNTVLTGRWPDRADEALVAHASGCETCREIAQVSMLLREDADHSRFDVHVPAAGQVWWRAAVRARLESTHAAARPMRWMHAITGAVVLGGVLAAITAVWPMLPGLWRAVRGIQVDLVPSAEVAVAIGNGLAQSMMVGVIAAALLIIAPLALYLVLSDE
jgi:hypothetical protein